MLLTETTLVKPVIEEKDSTKLPDSVLCRVTYNICNIGERNANKRVYEGEVWDNVLGNETLQEMIATRRLFGQAEHPIETQSDLQLTSHVIHAMWMDENRKNVFQTIDVLDTPMGRIVDSLIRAGCGVGVSTRAEGDLEESEDDQGSFSRVIPESYRYITTDFTADPSTFHVLPQDIKRTVVSAVQCEMVNESASNEEKAFARMLMENLKCENEESKTCSETDVRQARIAYFEAIEEGHFHQDALKRAVDSVQGKVKAKDLELLLRGECTMESLVKEGKIKEGTSVIYGGQNFAVQRINEASNAITLRPDIQGRSVEIEQSEVVITGNPVISVAEDGTVTIIPVPEELEAAEPDLEEELPMEEEPEPESGLLEPGMGEACKGKHADKKKMKKGSKEYIKEGVWSVPFSSEQAEKILELMKKEELEAGEAQDALYDLFGSDDLFNELDAIQSSSTAQVKKIVAKYLQQLIVDIEHDPEDFQGTFDSNVVDILMGAIEASKKTVGEKKTDEGMDQLVALRDELLAKKESGKWEEDDKEKLASIEKRLKEMDVDLEEAVDLRIKEAITRAEKEKALERIEELSESIGSLKHEGADAKMKLKMILGKMREAARVYDEVNALRAKLEEKTKVVHDSEKDLAEAKAKLEEQIVTGKKATQTLSEKHEKEVKSMEETKESCLRAVKEKYGKKVVEAKDEGVKEGTKKVISDYVDRRLAELDLSIGENTRALLDDCESIHDVEDVLEKTKDMQRRDALHSEPITEIRVRSQHTDLEQARINKEVGGVMDAMS